MAPVAHSSHLRVTSSLAWCANAWHARALAGSSWSSPSREFACHAWLVQADPRGGDPLSADREREARRSPGLARDRAAVPLRYAPTSRSCCRTCSRGGSSRAASSIGSARGGATKRGSTPGGVEKDVELVETDAANDAVDAAYHDKYGRRYASIVPSIVAPEARDATLKLVPREDTR